MLKHSRYKDPFGLFPVRFVHLRSRVVELDYIALLVVVAHAVANLLHDLLDS